MKTLCRYCKSEDIIRNGRRLTTERGRVQVYRCKSCSRQFCEDDGYRWKHKSKETITNTIELYIGGLSSRFVAHFERLSKNTVIRWIYEYSQRISRFTNRIKPKLASKLHLDELFLKMCNTFFYIWDSICADTRFATIVFSPTRGKKSAEKLILESPNTNDMVF
ncbi:MAG: IS1/IS6 family transposase, partial [Candidatus Micrarchaeota archaeon]|nr:IS1/IS6 family transposase [Candidatus Micrarchaeota archaeon]